MERCFCTAAASYPRRFGWPPPIYGRGRAVELLRDWRDVDVTMYFRCVVIGRPDAACQLEMIAYLGRHAPALVDLGNGGDEPTKTIQTETSSIIAYLGVGAVGSVGRWFLSHGFPLRRYAYDEVAPVLAAAAGRVVQPGGLGVWADPISVGGHYAQRATGSAWKRRHRAAGCAEYSRGDSRGVRLGRIGINVAGAPWPNRVAGLVSYAGYDVIDVARLGQARSRLRWSMRCGTSICSR